MKEIGIANTIVKRRHEMGLTQDELATSLGVTKASVSKWETGLSYPDIIMLPKLASFFNVSIDQLLDYTPQLTHQEINKLYKKLADEFAEKPFAEVYEECESHIKKYYSCFPFLLQMCILYLNHYPMAGDVEASAKVIREICELCNRIKTECDEPALIKDTVSIEALAHLVLSQVYAASKPELMKQELGIIFDLLGKDIKPPLGDCEVLINAYQLQGNIDKAKQLCQVFMYSTLASLFTSFLRLLSLYADQPDRLEEIINRCMKLFDTFHIDSLNPNAAACFYYQCASVYIMQKKQDAAHEMLKKYLKSCICLFENMTLHSDSFFDQLDSWFESYDIGTQPPRSKQLVYESIFSSLGTDSIFAELVDKKDIKDLITQLRRAKDVNN